MDDIVYTKFISSISECMETFCSRYLPFNQQVLLTGQLFLSVDFHERRDYVINEKLFVSPERQIVHACSSYINTTQQNHKIETAPRGYDANYAYTGAAYVATETASERALPSTENRWSGNANTTFPTVAETNKYSEKRQDHVNLPPNTSVAAVADTIQLGSSISNLECLKNACSLALANEDTGAERANIPSSSNIASVSKAADKIKYVGKIRTLNFNTDNLNVAIEKCKEEERKAAVDLLLDADSFDEESQVSDPSWKPKGEKRKRVVLPLAAKKQICMESERDPMWTETDLVHFTKKTFGYTVGTSTIGDILKNKEKYLNITEEELLANMKQFKRKPLRLRRGRTPIEKAKRRRDWDISDQSSLLRGKRRRVILTLAAKKQICEEKVKNPNLTAYDLVDYTLEKYDVRVGPQHINDILKLSDKYLNMIDEGLNNDLDSKYQLAGKRGRERRPVNPNKPIREFSSNPNKLYKCFYCDKMFKYYQLRRHESLVHGEKKYKCRFCEKEFNNPFYGKDHERFFHIKDEKNWKFKCDECGKMFLKNYFLKSHKKHVHGPRAFQCGTCGKSFTTSAYLNKHYEIHTNRERSHKCDNCGKGFKTASTLKKHIQVVHIGRVPVACDLCGKNMSTKWQVKKHQKKSCPRTFPPILETKPHDILYTCLVEGRIIDN